MLVCDSLWQLLCVVMSDGYQHTLTPMHSQTLFYIKGITASSFDMNTLKRNVVNVFCSFLKHILLFQRSTSKVKMYNVGLRSTMRVCKAWQAMTGGSDVRVRKLCSGFLSSHVMFAVLQTHLRHLRWLIHYITAILGHTAIHLMFCFLSWTALKPNEW